MCSVQLRVWCSNCGVPIVWLHNCTQQQGRAAPTHRSTLHCVWGGAVRGCGPMCLVPVVGALDDAHEFARAVRRVALVKGGDGDEGLESLLQVEFVKGEPNLNLIVESHGVERALQLLHGQLIKDKSVLWN